MQVLSQGVLLNSSVISELSPGWMQVPFAGMMIDIGECRRQYITVEYKVQCNTIIRTIA